MTYNSKVLRDVLKARALTPAQLSQRLHIDLKILESELQRDPEPKQGILQAIARDLAVPSFVFYMKEAPPLHDILPDYRSATPSASPKSRGTIETVQLAEGIQKALIAQTSLAGAKLPSFPDIPSEQVASFALKMREHFKITLDDQRKAKDTKAFYNLCRKRIEELGILVVQESFPPEDGSGFCLSHPVHPIIVVNTAQQSRGRRLFTLIHELAHVLMKRSGISDPFISENKTERLCNRFASAFLVPAAYVHDLLGKTVPSGPTTDDVRWAAGRLKISQEATVVRLEELGLFQTGTHEKWKAQFHNLGNPDFADKGGGAGVPPPQEKVKFAKFGFRVAAAFQALLDIEQVSEIEIYRLTGIKPKYQKAYFDYASALSIADLRTLDLHDE